MLKLIRYEFRKNRTLLLVVLGVIAALEAYFLFRAHASARLNAINNLSEAANSAEVHLIVAMSLLVFASFGTALAVFIMGVAGYSRELNQKTSYLVFMTPQSTLSIVGAKLLFTLITGVGFAGLLAAFAALDFPMMLDSLGREWVGYYNMLDWFMTENDLNLTGALMTIAFFVCVVFLSIIATVSIAYLAITLSATFMRGRKGHALVSVLLFLLLSWGNSRLTSLFFNADSYLSLSDAAGLMRVLTPQLLLDAAILALSVLACAWMLKKRVDL